MNLTSYKFTSKEVDFLKQNSGNEQEIAPPDTYLSDILKNETNEINSFKKRIESTHLVEEKFVCMVLKISVREKKKTNQIDDLLEKTFHTVLTEERGLWQRIDKNIYALAFWDYDNKKTATRILKSIKEKISSSINIDILTGASWFPYEDYSKLESFDNAVKALDHAAFFGRNATAFFDPVSIHIYGDRLYQLGHIEEASIEYQRGLELDKKNITLINSLGVCYGLINMLDKAKEEFKKVLSINPNEITSIYNLGLIYDLTDNLEKAVKYLKKADSIDNGIFEVELLLGSLLFRTDDTKRALHHLNRALDLKEESSPALRIKGEIYLKQNKLDKAASNFSKAVKINPYDAVSFSGLAKVYGMQNKNIDIALSFAKKSVNLDPDNQTFKKRLNEIIRKKEDRKASSINHDNRKIKSA